MGVVVKVSGQIEGREKDASEAIKSHLEAELTRLSAKEKSVDWRVDIVVGKTTYGGELRDIDIVLAGSFIPPITLMLKSRFNAKRKYSAPSNESNAVSAGAKSLSSDDELVSGDRLRVHGFLTTIEVKDVDISQIRFDGDRSFVQYSRSGKEKDVSTQSFKQKNALIRHLSLLGVKPYSVPSVTNVIWYRNIPNDRLPADVPHNYVGSRLTMMWMIRLIALQDPPYYYSKVSASHRGVDEQRVVADLGKKTTAEEIRNAVEKMCSSIVPVLTGLSREKLERITKQEILRDQKYVDAIGTKLLVIRGRAGTGKTMKLIHIAHDLAFYRGQEVLVLTFNKMLKSDLHRLLYHAGFSRDSDHGVTVKTVMSFMRDVLHAFGVYSEYARNVYKEIRGRDLSEDQEKNISDQEIEVFLKREYSRFFVDTYKYQLERLMYLRSEGLLMHSDYESIRKKSPELFSYDTLLVDEGQDWPDSEVEIVKSMFGTSNIIVSDGVDQMVRNVKAAKWREGCEHHVEAKGQNRSLRQRTSLLKFVALYAKKTNLSWDVEPVEDMTGGRVYVSYSGYTSQLHETLIQDLKVSNNSCYEHLFIAPGSLFKKTESSSYVVDANNVSEGAVVLRSAAKWADRSAFKYADEWKRELGVELWDQDLSDYPTSPDMHRVCTYQTCRGLEGWTSVLLEFDSFLAEALYSESKKQVDQDVLFPEQQIRTRALQAGLIALTRPVSNLVITFKERKGEMQDLVREIMAELPDIFVDVD